MSDDSSDKHRRTKRFVELWCPNMRVSDVQFPTHHWPQGIPTDSTIDSYVKAAETGGFSVSSAPGWGERFETIMLYYTERNREFQHAALQKSPGVWESKIGSWSDIEHPINGLDTMAYGTGRIFMNRLRP